MSRLRKWAGLQQPQEPRVDPDAWTPLARDLPVDDAETGRCEQAAKLVARLNAAGIEGRQHPYVLQDDISIGRSGLRLLGPGPAAADRIRVAVLVRRRDLERAAELVAGHVTKPDPPANKE